MYSCINLGSQITSWSRACPQHTHTHKPWTGLLQRVVNFLWGATTDEPICYHKNYPWFLELYFYFHDTTVSNPPPIFLIILSHSLNCPTLRLGNFPQALSSFLFSLYMFLWKALSSAWLHLLSVCWWSPNLSLFLISKLARFCQKTSSSPAFSLVNSSRTPTLG